MNYGAEISYYLQAIDRLDESVEYSEEYYWRRRECSSWRIGELVFQDSSRRRPLQLLAEVRFGIFELRVVPDRHPSLDLQISVYEGTTPASRQ